MIVIDHGFQDFFKELEELKRKEIAVGIFEPEVAEYAAYNEYGTSTIPQRSFMRSTLGANEDNVIDQFVDHFNTWQSLLMAADGAGDYLAGLIRGKILYGSFTPNAPSTIRRKGKDRPLIDTGRMLGSVKSIVRDAR